MLVWLAPEVMKDRVYTVKADIYSYGVILYEMLTHKQFFEEERFFSKMEQRIIAGERPELPQCYPELEQLIRDCWASDADARPSFASVIDRIAGMMRCSHPHHTAASYMMFGTDHGGVPCVFPEHISQSTPAMMQNSRASTDWRRVLTGGSSTPSFRSTPPTSAHPPISQSSPSDTSIESLTPTDSRDVRRLIVLVLHLRYAARAHGWIVWMYGNHTADTALCQQLLEQIGPRGCPPCVAYAEGIVQAEGSLGQLLEDLGHCVITTIAITNHSLLSGR